MPMRQRKKVQALPRPVSRLGALAGAAFLGVLLLAGCGGTDAPASSRGAEGGGPAGGFVVAGVVRETGGFPIGGVPVQVLAVPRSLPPDPRLDRQGLEPLAETRTAADGTYRLSFPLRTGSARYYLSFFAPGFDEVRYARPDRVEFTSHVRPGGHWVFDLRIPSHGGWSKVQEVLKAYSKDSDKARVIRGYGIAEEVRVKPGEPGAEVWWYYSRGKSFTFRGDALEGETTFAPVLK